METKVDLNLRILIFWRDDFTRETLVESFQAYGYSNTHGVASPKTLWSLLKVMDFQILILSENDMRKVSSKARHFHPDLKLAVLTLNHDPGYHKRLRVYGAHGVLMVDDIKTTIQELSS